MKLQNLRNTHVAIVLDLGIVLDRSSGQPSRGTTATTTTTTTTDHTTTTVLNEDMNDHDHHNHDPRPRHDDDGISSSLSSCSRSMPGSTRRLKSSPRRLGDWQAAACHGGGRVLPPGRQFLEHARCKSHGLSGLKEALDILESEIAFVQTASLHGVPKKA